MSHPLSPNVHLHLHLLGLWQENPSQGMSYHLCRESPPWLLLKTQTPTMTDPPLQGERAPVLDRDPEPVLETPGPGKPWALQPLSLSAPRDAINSLPTQGRLGSLPLRVFSFGFSLTFLHSFICSMVFCTFFG